MGHDEPLPRQESRSSSEAGAPRGAVPNPSMGRSLAAPLLVAALIFTLFELSPGARADWKIDEAQKLQESWFYRLVERGDFTNPYWMDTFTARTNPPVGKYVFGLALRLQGFSMGEPSDLELFVAPGDRVIPGPALDRKYRPLLYAIRKVSILAVALTGAILWWMAGRLRGLAAALVAVLVFALHPLVRTGATQANFDPLLTLLVAATGPPLLLLWERPGPRRALLCGMLAGFLSAAAFQTRVNGLVAGGAAAVVISGVFLRGYRRPAVIASIASGLTFLAVAVGSNPFYWTHTPPHPGVPGMLLQPHALPVRVLFRFRRQVTELGDALNWPILTRWRLTTIPSRVHFFFMDATLAGPVGLTLLFGLACYLIAILRSRRPGFELFWGGTIALVIALWIPLAWGRYAMVALPSLALLSGLGFGTVVALLRNGRAPAEDPGTPAGRTLT